MKTQIQDIPAVLQAKMIASGSWRAECPVSIERLKLLNITHYNFSGNLICGQMIVLDSISEITCKIFQSLLSIKFPIYQIRLVDEYGANDTISMEANNSSCFNFRNIGDTQKLSIHSYGTAIDINPLQNPYIIKNAIFPKNGLEFLDRSNIRPGMVEPIVTLFKSYGFEWGGDWNDAKDYHHFQINPEMFGF